ncbi:hypothetical protein KR767_11215 [Luteibacter anthropi]|uniref:Uncharacterized protein n=1 Tax=Luteibacter anthropi TaxID=564369 RepID=A0A7X5U9N9_9GAMM|nr:DUF6229 family protein [Luteibacter anthropi]NII06465.1 hypothetical protein [Luteibacter anthropi]URX60680.1 hypothetical protein KR767_11215 [Luteibacter anthropi]
MEKYNDVNSLWRNEAGSDNPAGPLYAAGAFAESEIANEAIPTTVGGCGTACTGSRTRQCC